MIDSRSAFYYGYQINSQPFNGSMDLNEGAGAIEVNVPVGSYTLTTIQEAVLSALLSQATLEYEVAVNRTTRKFTISAPSTFSLLTNSGQNTGNSIWSLLGFDTSFDHTGSTSYTSEFASGDIYKPQFFLQSYVPPEDFQGKQQATKNVASNGTTVEVVNFGIAKFIELDIKFITSRDDIADGQYIHKNPTGLEDARRFMQNITELSEFEFLPDINQPAAFYRCILESTPAYPDGTGYRLQELFNRNLRDVYETGILRMRVIE